MKLSQPELLEQVLALPEFDRLEFANQVFDSIPLPPGQQPMTEEQYGVMLHERARQMREGEVTPVPWEQTRRKIEAQLAEIRRGKAESAT